jgi:ABC-type multidrug transport system fused ATPase/permease subunit
MSIKDNILYGDDKASDEKVMQMASLANALQFIESNIEDLDKDEVKNKIIEDLIKKVD